MCLAIYSKTVSHQRKREKKRKGKRREAREGDRKEKRNKELER